jgi:hypothetical protein
VEIAPVKTPGASALIAAGANATWREAQDFNLGQTVFGSGDDRPYIPISSDVSYDALMAGVQWFRFTSND